MSQYWLDIVTTVLGLIYIWLEYKASIALWIVGIVMPALDVWLYWTHGLYGDAGMAVYYTVAAIYGYAVWKFGRKKGQKEGEDMPITHFRRSLILPVTLFLRSMGFDMVGVSNLYQQHRARYRRLYQRPKLVGLWALSRNTSSNGSSGLPLMPCAHISTSARAYPSRLRSTLSM